MVLSNSRKSVTLRSFALPALTTCYMMIAQFSAHLPWHNPNATPPSMPEQSAEIQPASEPKQPIEERVVTVDKGDTLQSVLTDADVDNDEAFRAVAAMKNVFNMKALKTGSGHQAGV